MQPHKIVLKKVRVHILLDGRDVPPTSALDYVDRFEAFLKDINDDGTVDYRIASGGGRMEFARELCVADACGVVKPYVST